MQKINFLFLNPSATLVYKWNSRLTSDLWYKYDNYAGDILDFADAYMMIDYRSFRRGSGILSKKISQSHGLQTIYRNPLDGLFINMRISRRMSKSNLLNRTDFTGVYSLLSVIESDRSTDFRTLNGSISKYFRPIRTTVSLSSSYEYASSQQIQQGAELVWTNKTVSLRPKIDTKIRDKLNVAYSLSYNNIKTHIKESRQDNPSINQFHHFLTVNAFPSKQWILKGKMDYYQS